MLAGQRPQPLTLQKQRVNTMGKDIWPEPSSPAATTITTFSSLSWAAEKSAAELRVHLKNAHLSLREKEKDLTLAAEIGHYLLENNAALKSQYETLLHQQIIEQEQQDDLFCDEQDRDMVLLSQHQSHQRVLGELQDKNMELQRLLEDAQHQTDKVKMVHDKKARELEYDITLLKDHLELAAQRIEEIQDHPSLSQQQQQQQQLQLQSPLQQQQLQEEYQQQHDVLLMELQHKINQLEHENNQLVHNRQTIQDRLDRALYDVESLQTQFNIGEWTREGYTQLNEAYQRQFSHIAQLTISLEEHRHILTHLVESGGHLPSSSYSSSSTTLQSTSDRNNSLMAELEKAWHRDQNWHYDHDHDHDDGYSSLSGGPIVAVKPQASSCFTDTSCFYAPPDLVDSSTRMIEYGKDNDDDYDDYDDDTMAMITYKKNDDDMMMTIYNDDNDNDNDNDDLFGPLDASSNALTAYNLYPDMTHHTYSTGLIMSASKQQQQQPPIGMVNKVQRWCRFALVLTVAVFINVFEGPDRMLEEVKQ